MALHKLVFDTTDAETMLSSANVGAYVRSSDGTLIDKAVINTVNRLAVDSTLKDGAGNALTSTDNALDVNIASSDIQIDVDLDHTEDSVSLGNGTDLFTSTTVGSDIGLDVNLINASVVVTATDLDIRDLAYASDSVTAHQGGTWTIDSITNTVTVSATDLDIRDLTHVSDSVSLGNGTDLFTSTTIGSDIGLDINVINDPSLANTAIKANVNPLDTANTAEDVVAVANVLANRKYLFVQNDGKKDIFIGESGVTAASGFRLPSGSILELRAGPAVDIEFVGITGASGAEATVSSLQLS